MPLRPDMEPKDFLEIFLRRKWLIIFSFLFILLGASVYCVVTPEKYISSTTILVIPQRVPEGYVRSTQSSRIEERLATINQQVMSRTRLVLVMQDLDLFRAERKNQPLEDVVENMRKRIALQVRGNDAFTLSFIHEDPKTAMLTASRLASFFIDENLRNREQQAIGTADFLGSQLGETKAVLEAKEKALGDYKLRHMGELPQQLESNLRMLTQFQEQAKVNAENIRYQEDRREILETQLKALVGGISYRGSSGNGAGGEATPKSDDRGSIPGTAFRESFDGQDPALQLLLMLRSKKEQLASLESRYTENYPGMARLKQEISLLEQKIVETRRLAATRGAAGNSPGKTPDLMTDAELQIESLREKLRGARLEMAALKRERADLQKNVERFSAKVEGIPKREQELVALTRDYENIKISYDELLRKKLDAEIASNLEKRQKGEQFHILDPANLPARPFEPNRPLIFGIAFAIAAIAGFGGALGLEIADESVREIREFKHYVPEIPVLIAVPIVQDKTFKRKMMMRRAAIVGGLVSFSLVLTVFLIVYGQKVRTILLG
jgi:polysaccharide chain length determinant protein (PEP-CTERM system associated)